MGGIMGGHGGGVLSPITNALGLTSSYDAQQAPLVTQDLVPVYQQSQQAFNQNYGAQQALVNQLMAQQNGQGPNLAQAQLNQATSSNIKNQAALMASQRGINPGLAARLAAQQGAGIQQEAAGQSGLLRAQQALANQQQLAGLYGQMGGQQLQNQQIVQGAIGNQNNASVGSQSNVNNVNSGTALANARTTGGIFSGIGQALSLSHGGMVDCYADGGAVLPQGGQLAGVGGVPISNGPQSTVGKFMQGFTENQSQAAPTTDPMQQSFNAGQDAGYSMASLIKSAFAPSAVGGGNGISSPNPIQSPLSAPVAFVASGGKVPGQAAMPGDHIQNDNVPAMLSPKEIVLPRSVTMAKDAPEKAKAFVEAILARQKMGKK